MRNPVKGCSISKVENHGSRGWKISQGRGIQNTEKPPLPWLSHLPSLPHPWLLVLRSSSSVITIIWSCVSHLPFHVSADFKILITWLSDAHRCNIIFGGSNDLCSRWAVPLCIFAVNSSSPRPTEDSVCTGAGCASPQWLTVLLETSSCCSFQFSPDYTTVAVIHVLSLRGRREYFCFLPGYRVKQASFRICFSAGWWGRLFIPYRDSILRHSP